MELMLKYVIKFLRQQLSVLMRALNYCSPICKGNQS